MMIHVKSFARHFLVSTLVLIALELVLPGARTVEYFFRLFAVAVFVGALGAWMDRGR